MKSHGLFTWILFPWILLLLLLSGCASAPQRAPSSVVGCSDVFASASSLRASRVPAPQELPTFKQADYENWILADFEKIAEKPAIFEYQTIDGQTVRVTQSVRLVSSLSAPERNLVQKILYESRRRKFVEKGIRSQAVLKEVLILEFLEGHSSAETPSTSEIRAAARSMAEEVLQDGIEFGMWRITTRDGKVVTAPHTSSHPESIFEDAMLDALNGASNSHRISPNQLARVQYFHNHPRDLTTPLSRSDVLTAEILHERLSRESPEVRFEILAISRTREGEVLLYSRELGGD